MIREVAVIVKSLLLIRKHVQVNTKVSGIKDKCDVLIFSWPDKFLERLLLLTENAFFHPNNKTTKDSNLIQMPAST